MKHIDNKKGYTLIELIVVVAVMGILTSVAVVSISALTKYYNTQMCFATKQSIIAAYTEWQNKYPTYDKEKDKEIEEKYPDEPRYWPRSNPFLDNVNSYNSSTDEFENIFKQSFVDELNESCVELSCPLKNHYYVIAYNGIDLTITCYDENGNPTPDHNNS